jgi:hypothetical protein
MSAVAEATTTFIHLIEAGMLSPYNKYINYLTEARVRSIAVAVPNAIQRYTGQISALVY